MSRRQRWIGLAVVAAAVVTWSMNASSESTSKADKSSRDLIMVRCDALKFEVLEYKGSASSPSRKSGNCPDQLSQLARDGFSISDVGHFDDQEAPFLVYTLAR